jgi:hypothetical protein
LGKVVRLWKWRTLLEIFGILAGIGYAVVTYFQWQEMRKQTIEANRAWMAPGAVHFHDAPVVGKPVTVIFPHENVGREPAIDMKESMFDDASARRCGRWVDFLTVINDRYVRYRTGVSEVPECEIPRVISA